MPEQRPAEAVPPTAAAAAAAVAPRPDSPVDLPPTGRAREKAATSRPVDPAASLDDPAQENGQVVVSGGQRPGRSSDSDCTVRNERI